MKRCPDCNKPIDIRSSRCRSCCRKGILSRNYKSGKPKCLDCNKPLKNYRSKRCWKCGRVGKNNPKYIDGRTSKKSYCIDCGTLKSENGKRCRPCSYKFKKKSYYCLDCNKELSRKDAKRCHSCNNKNRWKSLEFRLKQLNRKRRSGWKHSEKTKLMFSKTRKGKDNGNWKGGVSRILYPPEFNKALKKKIYTRDGFTCQLCFKYPCNYLNAHHIDYDKQNCKEENLITLCRRCHNKTNNNREYWKNYFQRRTELCV